MNKKNIVTYILAMIAIVLSIISVFACYFYDRPDISFFSTCGLFYMLLPESA